MINILYENDDIVAADKPEGLATIPESEKEKDCLLTLLEEKYKQKLFIVHRLDKEASGVILFARNAAAHRFLNQEFEMRRVRKTYMLLVHGRIETDEGTIEKPLRLFGSGRTAVDENRGKPSQTDYRVRRRFKAFTLVEAHPATSRRHQLRVHFYSLGHPVAGDRRYGEKSIQRQFLRLMLHAESIALRLPDGSEVTVTAPLPESFQKVLLDFKSGN